MYFLHKLQYIRLALIGILAVYTIVTLGHAWGRHCSNYVFGQK